MTVYKSISLKQSKKRLLVVFTNNEILHNFVTDSRVIEPSTKVFLPNLKHEYELYCRDLLFDILLARLTGWN